MGALRLRINSIVKLLWHFDTRIPTWMSKDFCRPHEREISRREMYKFQNRQIRQYMISISLGPLVLVMQIMLQCDGSAGRFQSGISQEWHVGVG
jgi:hypothetical protein